MRSLKRIRHHNWLKKWTSIHKVVSVKVVVQNMHMICYPMSKKLHRKYLEGYERDSYPLFSPEDLEYKRLNFSIFTFCIFWTVYHCTYVLHFLGEINGDRQRLDLGWWTHNTLYRWCVTELCVWKLYNFVSELYPRKFHKKEKIRN